MVFSIALLPCLFCSEKRNMFLGHISFLMFSLHYSIFFVKDDSRFITGYILFILPIFILWLSVRYLEKPDFTVLILYAMIFGVSCISSQISAIFWTIHCDTWDFLSRYLNVYLYFMVYEPKCIFLWFSAMNIYYALNIFNFIPNL